MKTVRKETNMSHSVNDEIMETIFEELHLYNWSEKMTNHAAQWIYDHLDDNATLNQQFIPLINQYAREERSKLR